MKKHDFRINDEYIFKAPNPLSARSAFKKVYPDVKVFSIKMETSETQKLVTKAAAAGPIRVGVQRSMCMGFGDLPLFQKNEQTDLF